MVHCVGKRSWEFHQIYNVDDALGDRGELSTFWGQRSRSQQDQYGQISFLRGISYKPPCGYFTIFTASVQLGTKTNGSHFDIKNSKSGSQQSFPVKAYRSTVRCLNHQVLKSLILFRTVLDMIECNWLMWISFLLSDVNAT